MNQLPTRDEVQNRLASLQAIRDELREAIRDQEEKFRGCPPTWTIKQSVHSCIIHRLQDSLAETESEIKQAIFALQFLPNLASKDCSPSEAPMDGRRTHPQ